MLCPEFYAEKTIRITDTEKKKTMGKRTNGRPKATDSFLKRICHALDEPPRMLAANLDVAFSELRPLLKGHPGSLVEMDRDEVWFSISAYINVKIGTLTAIKYELDKALQSQRRLRVSRVERFKRTQERRTCRTN